MTEPEIQYAATCQMHDKGEQDDGQDGQNKPYEDQHNARDGESAEGPSSSHERSATHRCMN